MGRYCLAHFRELAGGGALIRRGKKWIAWGRKAVAASFLIVAAYAVWCVIADPDGTRSALGEFLWVRQQPEAADFVYVLGGDYLKRIPLALKLYRKGLARQIVVPREYMPTNGEQEHFTDASMRLLREAGLPPSAMFEWRFGQGVSSTSEEMSALRAYRQAGLGGSRGIVLTSQYHTRRAIWMAYCALRGTGTMVQVIGSEPEGWQLNRWWLSPQGQAVVKSEYVKLIYYWPRSVLGY